MRPADSRNSPLRSRRPESLPRPRFVGLRDAQALPETRCWCSLVWLAIRQLCRKMYGIRLGGKTSSINRWRHSKLFHGCAVAAAAADCTQHNSYFWKMLNEGVSTPVSILAANTERLPPHRPSSTPPSHYSQSKSNTL